MDGDTVVTDIVPCWWPNCAGKTGVYGDWRTGRSQVGCDACDAAGPHRRTPAEAISAWNAARAIRALLVENAKLRELAVSLATIISNPHASDVMRQAINERTKGPQPNGVNPWNGRQNRYNV